jgi:hypothetical protein
MVLVAALLILTAAASASSGQDPEAQMAPSPQDIEQAYEEGGHASIDGAGTDAQAAEELPHDELGREAAEQLFTSVFGELAEEQAEALGDLDAVSRFYSDHVAVIETSDESGSGLPGVEEEPQRALIDSLLPLRAENDEGVKEPVDLGLEATEGEFQPANPLVDIGVPADLGEGISIPSAGVSITLADGAEERSPSITSSGPAFYPNVAEDSDLTVSATPTGVETQTLLRTPDAPRAQRFHIDMPSDAALKETEDGGALVSGKDKPLLRIPPPSAIDAEGSAVPVSLAVDGSVVTVTVTPSTDAYPILVDPYYESAFFWWLNNSTEGTDEWTPASQSGRYGTPVRGAFNEPGLHIYSYAGSIAPGSQANWNWHVPRYFSDKQAYGVPPTTYIQKMTLSELHWWIEESKPYQEHPFVLMGIWDEKAGWWNTFSTRNGVQGELHPPYTYNMDNTPQPNGEPTTGVKFGGVSMSTFESVSRPRHLLVGQASVQISDLDNPYFEQVLNPEKWVNETPAPVGYTAADLGLGIYGVYLTTPNVSGAANQSGAPIGCFGNVKSSCPRNRSGELATYNPKLMPQGENTVQLAAADPIWHWSESAVGKIKVDHTKPSLSLSGTLTEQQKVGVNAAQYTLKYSATDGDHAAPAALAPFGGAGAEPGKTQTPSGIAIDPSGNVYVVDKANSRVAKFDASGKFLTQFGSYGSANGQLKEPRGIAIAPNGDLWIADSGNSRVQHFSSAGVYKSQFGSSGTGGGTQFTNPYGIAVAYGIGSLSSTPIVYVSDAGQNRVGVYKEDGYFFGNVMGSQEKLDGPALFGEPSGIAVDANKNLWVADAQNSRVQRFNPENKFVLQFGSKGSGNGQLSGPVNVAIAPSGNVMVVDGANHRIQEFNGFGAYLRTFGSTGSGNAQLSNPKGIASQGGTAYISDADNHRVARWSHADFDPQSGAASTQVKLDGALVEPKHVPGCPTRDCEINREWLLNADLYPVGAHDVEVVTTDGVGLSTSKSISIETHGDLKAPEVGLSGSLTEQSALGTTRPSYLLKVSATDPGSLQERRSGVSSVSIKVDGKPVDVAAPGCPGGGCSISREWTLSAAAYSVGAHTVLVTATDAAGRAASKSFSISIAKDNTPPQVSAPETFFTAPEGWLEQTLYSYAPSVTDVNGYGVTSIALKIDGLAVKTAAQTCVKGSCPLSIAGSINMASYTGGSHPAELVAIDGAGNTTTKSWTINVNPSGTVPASEASDTVEALERSVAETPVAPTAEVLDPAQMKSGDDPSLVKAPGGIIESVGTPDVTTISGNEVTVIGPEYSLTITPLLPPPPDPSIITEEIAAIRANIAKEADLVIRPQYNGMMQFAQIRDATSPETYSWEMHMGADQFLASVDGAHAEVKYEDGTRAFLISAERAHDATGAAVDTSLSVSGKTLSLTVHHRAKAFVYPVIAGQAFETSYVPGTVVMPPTEQEIEQQAQSEDEGNEAVEDLESAREPLSPAEFSDATEFLFGGGAHRNPNKPITLKQARHISRKHSPRPTISAPRVNLIGGPGANGAGGYEYTYDVSARTCSALICDIWNVHYSPETEFALVRTGSNSGNVEYASPYGEVHCGEDTNFWWSLNLEVDPESAGTRGPTVVHKHSGEHLTFWCKFHLSIWYVPEIKGPEMLSNDSVLIDQVFPNGYQKIFTKPWEQWIHPL